MKTPKKRLSQPLKKRRRPLPGGKTRKMEPLKSKELKNQKFDELDEEDDEQIDPEMLDDNFKGFDDGYDDDEDDI
ncbi:MAG: hypothetical protein IPM91_07560 [Bacteroidetes bacterium]|nr:hypothetical protein [Bacteroidota bacterium]